MSDNELDNLFKEAADGFKAPNDPSAWQAMSSKLDQAAVTTSFWNWKTISSFTLVGVTGIALLLYVSGSETNQAEIAAADVTQLHEIGKKSVDEKPAANEDKATASPNMENKSDLTLAETDRNKSVASANQKSDKAESSLNSDHAKNSEGVETRKETKASKLVMQEKNQANVTTNAVTQKPIDTKSSGSVVENQTNVTTNPVNSKEEITSTENKSEQAALVAGVAVTQKPIDTKSSGSVVENQASVTTSPVSSDEENKNSKKVALIAGVAVTEKSLDSKSSSGSIEVKSDQTASNRKSPDVQSNSAVAADSVKKLEEEKEELSTEKLLSDPEKKPEEKDSKSESLNSFAIKLAVAPDYTTVKSATPNSLGINYGVLFEYRFSKHWAVATGGIWSKKIYSATDVEYNGYYADYVDGDCRMWDIPINVYYNFLSNKPFSFYASVGLSSYLMNEENYVYYVETPYGEYEYAQQVKGENNEWFKTLNVSIGMQYRMSQRFSLQFEPTLKAPLAGVGEGEVSLVSLGAFFNLRYDIPLSKTRR